MGGLDGDGDRERNGWLYGKEGGGKVRALPTERGDMGRGCLSCKGFKITGWCVIKLERIGVDFELLRLGDAFHGMPTISRLLVPVPT